MTTTDVPETKEMLTARSATEGGRMISVAASAFVHHTTLDTLGEPGEIPYGWERDGKVGGPRPHDTLVEVMPRAVVREYVTVQRPIVAGGTTRICAGAMVMSHAHIAHDCDIGENAVIATGARLGGHTIVQAGAYVGLGAMTHQWVIVGAYSILGIGAVVIADVPPFATVVGNPARIVGVNRVGMERAGFDASSIELAAMWLKSEAPIHENNPLLAEPIARWIATRDARKVQRKCLL